MTKDEAIKRMVEEFNAVPQEWVRIVAEHEGDPHSLPMWGTMWIVDRFYGETFMKHSRVMAPSPQDIDIESIEEGDRAKISAQVDNGEWPEEYIDEEMAYERCVLDKDGFTTAVFIYEIGDEYVIGVNGAGWNFYDGVWDKLYDLMGLKWHEDA